MPWIGSAISAAVRLRMELVRVMRLSSRDDNRRRTPMSFRFSQKRNNKFDVKGLSHVAIVVSDMQRTVDFYEGLLGFPLIKTVELPEGTGQHFFFDMGDGQSSLAFFWFPQAKTVESGITVPKFNIGYLNPAGEPGDYTTVVGSLNHIAFNVDPIDIPKYKAKLEAAGVWVSQILTHYDTEMGIGINPDHTLWLSSIYFRDPDGVQLEFSAWHRPFTDADIADAPATTQSTPWTIEQSRSVREPD
jgi:catechol 2,3-dioxygenase-like lactoylglutathione lyase family enzyme